MGPCKATALHYYYANHVARAGWTKCGLGMGWVHHNRELSPANRVANADSDNRRNTINENLYKKYNTLSRIVIHP